MSLKNIAITLIMASFLFMLGCKPSQSAQEEQEQARLNNMERANAAVPTPHVDNFLNRKAAAEYMIRMDDPSKTFYVYLVSYGKIMGYYVTRTHPISICQLMTPPKKEYQVHGRPEPLGPAPTLDGLYATNADCSHYYALTADTDTLVEFTTDLIISDQPIPLEADKLNK